jgi:hypothetical protein
MVVGDFDIVSVTIHKAEANPPLFVDADAPLSFAVSFEGFKTVSRRDAQIVNTVGIVDLFELFKRGLCQMSAKLAAGQPFEDGRCLRREIAERMAQTGRQKPPRPGEKYYQLIPSNSK